MAEPSLSIPQNSKSLSVFPLAVHLVYHLSVVQTGHPLERALDDSTPQRQKIEPKREPEPEPELELELEWSARAIFVEEQVEEVSEIKRSWLERGVGLRNLCPGCDAIVASSHSPNSS